MRSEKIVVGNSPFIGVLSVLGNNFFLAPYTSNKKELVKITESTGLKPIKAGLAESPLLGVFCIAFKKRLAITELATKKEVSFLEENGFKPVKIHGVTAIGNLFKVINNVVLGPKTEKNCFSLIEDALGVEVVGVKVAGSVLVGSSIVGNKNGFVARPDITMQEFREIQDILGLEGTTSTANYGDRFIGNSVVANNKTILFGENTSTHEIFRIENVLKK